MMWRALKALGYEPSGPFVTSILELKLDTTTSFEWQKYSQGSGRVPHYSDLLRVHWGGGAAPPPPPPIFETSK